MLLACLIKLVDRLFRQALDRLKRLARRVGNRLDREEAIVAENLDNLIKKKDERGVKERKDVRDGIVRRRRRKMSVEC